jgi:hypothetical protein
MSENINRFEQGLSQKWKDGLNYGMAGFLILTAVVLAFVSFIITLTVGTGVIAWGGLSMGTALTLIGGGMYFHNQLVTFETNTNKKMEEMSAQVDKEIRRMRVPISRYAKDKAIEPEPEDLFNSEEEIEKK